MSNWKRLPNVLFSKAWHTTGHVSKEDALLIGGFDESDWENCHLTLDPLDLRETLGQNNIDEPSIEELIQNGRSQRSRVVWLLSSKENLDQMHVLPAISTWPIEKRLCHWLYAKSQGVEEGSKPLSTLVLNRRTGKDS